MNLPIQYTLANIGRTSRPEKKVNIRKAVYTMMDKKGPKHEVVNT
jgi:hypothetical protein